MSGIPLRLTLLLDARAPAGSQHHSGGMEAAVQAGYVDTVADVEQFCRGRLQTAGALTAAAAAAACAGWSAGWDAGRWAELDSAVSARTPSEAMRGASRALGAGLRRLLIVTVPERRHAIASAWAQIPAPAPHHPLVLGAAAGLTGASPPIAGRLAALSLCTAPASAAVRLLGLDPYLVHRVVFDLTPLIETVADAALLAEELPALTAPALELLADVHARQEGRLFAS